MTHATKDNRILIASHQKKQATQIKKLLEKGGFHAVETAASGQDVLDKCAAQKTRKGGDVETPFDLLILDLETLEVDGLEVCARLRVQNTTRNMPILICTATNDLEVLNQAYMAGADDFVIRPIDEVRLYARVRTLLRMRREQKRKELREADLRLQNLNLKQGKLEAALIEPITGLPRDGLVELLLNSCRQAEQSAALGLLQIIDFDLYMEFHGEEQANQLKADVAAILRSTAGPLSAVLCVYGPGTFMVVQPATQTSDEMMDMLARIKKTVDEAEIEHGNSLSDPNIVLHTSYNWGEGVRLVSLTGELLEGARTQLLEWQNDA